MFPIFAVAFFPLLTEAWLGVLAMLPAFAVPALNGLRILAIGTVRKSWRGQLPRRIGYGVGIPDFMFGLWSLTIAATGGFASTGMAVAWHVIGIAIMLMMLPIVFSVLRPPRLNAAQKGDARAILGFPLVLAPAGLASLFVIAQIISLYAIFRQLVPG